MILLPSVYAINETVALYDLTNISQADNLYTFVRYSNDLSDRYLMSGILIAGFLILFISMKSYGNKEALIASSFITTSIGVLFTMIDFVPFWLSTIMILGFILLFVLAMLRKDF